MRQREKVIEFTAHNYVGALNLLRPDRMMGLPASSLLTARFLLQCPFQHNYVVAAVKISPDGLCLPMTS